LKFAKIEAKRGIQGTYYFRTVPQSWDGDIIKQIHNLGHEIGYDYESLTSSKGNLSKAIKDFEKNLNKLREIVPVTTICMHGKPLSKYDNKNLWKHYNYRDYGIIAEPYFDLDYKDILYRYLQTMGR
jgi:hypothetical protein